MSLTDKQQRFVEEYLVDLNATQAAIRAGYSEKTAGSIGFENLQKPDIATAVEEAQAARSARTKVTADRVLLELARVGFAKPSDVVQWTEDGLVAIPSDRLSEDDAAAIESIAVVMEKDADGNVTGRVKLKMHSKLGALREMGKHLGIAEKLKVEAEGGGVLLIPVASIGEWEAQARAQQEQLARGREEATSKALGDRNGAGHENGSSVRRF